MKTNIKSIDDRKLTDRLPPVEELGAYEGFWTTTFDLNTEFFETDFLPSLMGLGAWEDRHWATRISLEKTLAQMSSATVMLDASRYQGRPRSLRIELLPNRGPLNNRLHAKVVVLVHDNGVRLMVSSSNLTENGYRKNIEVSACISASKKNPLFAPLIMSALLEATKILSSWWGPGLEALNKKAISVLNSLPLQDKPPTTWFAWSGGNISLLDQVLSKLPDTSPVERITIVSPFWSKEDGTGPVATLLSNLKLRKLLGASVNLEMIACPVPTKENEYLPSLPASYAEFDFSQYGVNTYAQAADPAVLPVEVQGKDFTGTRDLHAKCFLLEFGDSALCYMGSANFTRNGWGVLENPLSANIEAGLILLRKGKAKEELLALIPSCTGQKITLGKAGKITLAPYNPNGPDAPWPSFLIDARLTPQKGEERKLELHVQIFPDKIKGAWSLQLPVADDGKEIVILSVENLEKPKKSYHISLSDDLLRQLLSSQEVLVRWWAHNQGYLYPINVTIEARDELPIAPDASKPEERLLLAYYQGRISYEELFPPIGIDPIEKTEVVLESEASGVDTSGIQSYQIREFVESLEGIRNDLVQSCGSERTMKLALLGPVSPVELARRITDAVFKSERTPTAGGFQLIEILMCLYEARNYDTYKTWQPHLEKAIQELEALLFKVRTDYTDILGPKTSFNTYTKKIMVTTGK